MESKEKFIPLPNYYDDNVKLYFDIYGGIYEVNLESFDFVVKIYFYRIKMKANTELWSRRRSNLI